MPNAIVVNTLSGAVSEYSGFDFHALTPQYAGTATGLFLLGGDLDLTAPIVATLKTGTVRAARGNKRHVDVVYFGMEGTGNARMTVHTEKRNYAYQFPVLSPGVSRCKPGRGIRENYLAFELSNLGGAAFTLDYVEVVTLDSPARKV